MKTRKNTMTDRPTDPLGFHIAMMEELEARGLTDDLREWVNEACHKWCATDVELAALKLTRTMSVGQPVWIDGQPGIIIAISEKRVTIEYFYLTRKGTATKLKQKDPRGVCKVITPKGFETWRDRMRELQVDHAAALTWAAANGVDQ